MIKAIFFDLDGTLLPFDEKKFSRIYFDTLYPQVEFLKISKRNFFKALIKGALAEVHNDGKRTNEEVFWDAIKESLNMDLSIYKDVLDDYYNNQYLECIKATKPQPESKKIVEFCKENGLKVVLSTNPVFPHLAIVNRMKFVDLNEEDFDYITDYSNSRFSKPNKEYFIDILKTLDLKPDEVIIFGNNEIEDGLCGEEAGIRTYLLDKYLISKSKRKNIKYPIIKVEEVIDVIKKEISSN